MSEVRYRFRVHSWSLDNADEEPSVGYNGDNLGEAMKVYSRLLGNNDVAMIMTVIVDEVVLEIPLLPKD